MKRDETKIAFKTSTIETIDGAVFNWLQNEMNLSVATNEGFRKCPVLWVSSERFFQVKHNRDIRDENGTLIFPLIVVSRKSIQKNREIIGDPRKILDEQGGSEIVIARQINQDKTSNFANAAMKRQKGVLNSPSPKNRRTVYDIWTIPVPVYVDVQYDIMIRTEYQQQMNTLITPFLTRPGIVTAVMLHGNEGQLFEGFIQEDINENNTIGSAGEEEMLFESTISLKVVGYLIGDEQNQEGPDAARRENPVEIKLPRDRFQLGEKAVKGKRFKP